jgi:hypothetical protein
MGCGAANGLDDMANLGHFRFRMVAVLLACAATFQTIPLIADQVPVRHMEGLMHGFLALRSLDGKRLADGEMTQIAEGDRVTSANQTGIIPGLRIRRYFPSSLPSSSQVSLGMLHGTLEHRIRDYRAD